MSTTSRPIAKRTRQIVGISLPPELAKEVKAEAAARGLSLRKLFEEMWSNYKKADKAQGRHAR